MTLIRLINWSNSITVCVWNRFKQQAHFFSYLKNIEHWLIYTKYRVYFFHWKTDLFCREKIIILITIIVNEWTRHQSKNEQTKQKNDDNNDKLQSHTHSLFYKSRLLLMQPFFFHLVVIIRWSRSFVATEIIIIWIQVKQQQQIHVCR